MGANTLHSAGLHGVEVSGLVAGAADEIKRQILEDLIFVDQMFEFRQLKPFSRNESE